MCLNIFHLASSARLDKGTEVNIKIGNEFRHCQYILQISSLGTKNFGPQGRVKRAWLKRARLFEGQ